MRCSKARSYIDIQLDGELNPHRRKVLNKHLEKCQDCNIWATKATDLQLMLSAQPQPEFPAWVHANIMDKVHRLDNQRPSLIRRLKLAPVTATLAISLSFWGGAKVGVASYNNSTKTVPSTNTTLLSSNTTYFGENSLVDSYYAAEETNE
ncbi:MAG: zf-HC2 domain-containing protein [Candidatus Cloacimonetes bacterium]|nr:zf-HC2 domain-containing protein [Candidatus Cloacimonadota bacterium]